MGQAAALSLCHTACLSSCRCAGVYAGDGGVSASLLDMSGTCQSLTVGSRCWHGCGRVLLASIHLWQLELCGVRRLPCHKTALLSALALSMMSAWQVQSDLFLKQKPG